MQSDPCRPCQVCTAAIGRESFTSIFDHTEQNGEKTILFDDATGSPSGISLSEEVKAALRAAERVLCGPAPGSENTELVSGGETIATS